MHFRLFSDDFPILIEKGIIKLNLETGYKWTKSKVSLAEYFKWIGWDVPRVENGFWSPVEILFNEDRRTLSKSASRLVCDEKYSSKDFNKIKNIVLEYREKIELLKKQNQTEQEQLNKKHELLTKQYNDRKIAENELYIFREIRKIITVEENPDNIKTAIKQIKVLLT